MYRPTTIWVSMIVAAANTSSVMIAGTGIPEASPAPSHENAAPRSLIGRPSVYTSVSPRAIVRVASVAMNGATLPYATAMPLTAPNPVPTASPASNATASGAPPFNTPASTAPAMARTEPTDRSIPPVRITNVMPAAMIALIETWRVTLSRLPTVRNDGDSTVSAAINNTMAAGSPNRCTRIRSSTLEAPRPAGRGAASVAGCTSIRPPCGAGHDRLLRGIGPRELACHLAFVHHQDSIRHAEDFRQFSRDQDLRHAGARQIHHEPVQFHLGANVDTARRLAQQQHLSAAFQPL